MSDDDSLVKRGDMEPGRKTCAGIVLSLLLAASIALLPGCGQGNGSSKAFDFTTTDLYGQEQSLADFSDAKLILVNLWEPWCGPCVREMPSLQDLYEKYQDQGFIILGVFSDTSAEGEAAELVESLGITYPILRSSKDFEPLETGYVPTSVFMDGSGHILSEESLVGAISADEWEDLIQEYLGKV